MVHYGKHIIDPQTGLCEICDRGAIHEIRHGKRHGKQFLYSNQDGKFTYRPNDDDDDEVKHDSEVVPRHVRKPLYPEPPPARTRPAVQEQPTTSHRKAIRRDHSPTDDISHRSTPRTATIYYVDNTGQMAPKNLGLSDESRRTYVVSNHHSPPSRPVHAVQRRAATPPPPASDSWHSPRRRNNNSDTRIIERQHREKLNDTHLPQISRKAEMYYVQAPHNHNNFATLHSSVNPSHGNNKSSPRTLHQDENNRKPRQLEPIQRVNYNDIEPTNTRRTHKKLTPTYDLEDEDYIKNGSHPRPTRKIEKIYPIPRHYESDPQLSGKHLQKPSQNKNSSIYYIQSVRGY